MKKNRPAETMPPTPQRRDPCGRPGEAGYFQRRQLNVLPDAVRVGPYFKIKPQVSAGLERVWRKDGPVGWWFVVGTQLPGDPWYDKGLPGVLVMVSAAGRRVDGKGYMLTWRKPCRYFVPCASVQHFTARAKAFFLMAVKGTQDFRYPPPAMFAFGERTGAAA